MSYNKKYIIILTIQIISIESTMLIFEILRNGIAVASKQAPTASRKKTGYTIKQIVFLLPDGPMTVINSP